MVLSFLLLPAWIVDVRWFFYPGEGILFVGGTSRCCTTGNIMFGCHCVNCLVHLHVGVLGMWGCLSLIHHLVCRIICGSLGNGCGGVIGAVGVGGIVWGVFLLLFVSVSRGFCLGPPGDGSYLYRGIGIDMPAWDVDFGGNWSISISMGSLGALMEFN